MRSALGLVLLSGCFLFGERDPLVRGRIAIHQQRFSDADRELASVPPTHPGFQEAQFLLGTLLLVTPNEPAARAQMLAARALDPGAFDARTQWRTILAALSGKLAKRWTVKTAQVPSTVVVTDTARLVISNRGMLTAFDPKRGTLWDHALGARGGSARATAVVAGGRVFAVEHDHARAKLVALDLATGERVWSTELGRADNDQNPVVAGTTVIVGGAGDRQHGTLLAFRADTGTPLWTTPLDHPPGAQAIADGKLCTLVETSIACVELASGAIAWRYDGLDKAPAGMAIVAGGGPRLFVASNGSVSAFDVDQRKPGLAWKVRADPATTSAPVVFDGLLVLETADAIMAFDATTGAQRWIAHHERTSPLALAGKPILRVDDLWVGWTNDRVFAINHDHALVFEAAVGGGIAAAPVIGGGNELVIGISGPTEGVVGLAIEPWSPSPTADR